MSARVDHTVVARLLITAPRTADRLRARTLAARSSPARPETIMMPHAPTGRLEWMPR